MCCTCWVSLQGWQAATVARGALQGQQVLQHSCSGQHVLLHSSCRCSLPAAVYCRAGGRALHKRELKACTV